MSARGEGALAIVLHTHMPYVEGFGTWPFGEEWLWEALAGSYLPLLDLLDEGAPLTLSLTPVLCDQLEVPGLAERFYGFVEEVRRDTHAQDAAGMRAGGHEALAAELERAWSDYEGARENLRRRGGDVLGALAPHAAWTSAATHAILPLLATEAGVREQVRSGVRSHLRRFGEAWRGGFWLPECAHEQALEPVLREAGARAVCVELTARLGLGAPGHLQPLLAGSGLLLVPVDRAHDVARLERRGLPGGGRLPRLPPPHRPSPQPLAQRRRGLRPRRGAGPGETARGGLRRAHPRAARARRQRRCPAAGWSSARSTRSCSATGGMRASPGCGRSSRSAPPRVSSCCASTTRSSVASRRRYPRRRTGPAGSWGAGGDLSTWSGPQVAAHAFAARAAELDVLAAAEAAGPAAIRELMALQASDWPFMVTRGMAVPYALERIDGHARALQEALSDGDARLAAAGFATSPSMSTRLPSSSRSSGSLPAHRARLLAHADHARRHAPQDRVLGEGPRHHGARADDRVVADRSRRAGCRRRSRSTRCDPTSTSRL